MSTIIAPFRRALAHPLTLPFYVPALLLGTSLGLLRPILPLYAAALSDSYVVVGFILAGDALGTVLGDLPAGILLRRYRDKHVMIVGFIMIIFSALMLFAAQSIAVAVFFLFTFGAGRALFNVSMHTYIAGYLKTAHRGRGISMLGGVNRIGNAIGPAIGGFLAGAAGLRAPFLLLCVLCALGAAILIWFLKAGEVTPRSESHGFSVVTTFRSNSHTFVTAGAGQLFAQMIRAGRNVIIPLYAANVLGLDAQAIGIIVSISWALDMTLFYPAGWIMDNLGRKFAIVPSFVIQAAGIALIPLTQSFAGLAVSAALIGLGNGISSGTMMTLGSDLAPPGTRGEFLGMWRLIGDAGATGAPLIVGWIAGLVFLQAAAGAISGAGLLAAAIFAFLVPETLKK